MIRLMCIPFLILISTLLTSSSLVAQKFQDRPKEPASAMFAGGCFWSMESAFEHLPGVIEVEAGYAGGRSKNPTYDDYSSKGHREVVMVYYDPDRIAYAGLVEFYLKHINPLDLGGAFVDRGPNYAPAIYVRNEEEKKEALRVIRAIDAMKVFRKRISIPIASTPVFWMAEEYHQNYHRTHPAQYMAYRAESGRDEFISNTWGHRAEELTVEGSLPAEAPQDKYKQETSRADSKESAVQKEAPKKPWEDFKKPSREVLRKRISRLEYSVTQTNYTEPAFANKFWDHHEAGLYVDVVSGEPLFASFDKFDSGTGWPSFTKPISEEFITFALDDSENDVRTEVRSKYGDSHLGHVFNDGPRDRGGNRFCINSASLRFIAVAQLEARGYGDYLPLFVGGEMATKNREVKR